MFPIKKETKKNVSFITKLTNNPTSQKVQNLHKIIKKVSMTPGYTPSI
jgi:hypothetical protein